MQDLHGSEGKTFHKDVVGQDQNHKMLLLIFELFSHTVEVQDLNGVSFGKSNLNAIYVLVLILLAKILRYRGFMWAARQNYANTDPR